MGMTLVFLSFLGAVELPKPPEGTPIIPIYESSTEVDVESAGLDEANMYLFNLPDSAVPTPAILICPGGAYAHLAIEHEGYDVAKWLNSHGIAAAVLQYRIAPHRFPAPLQDAQQAIRLIREHSESWNIDPEKTGILGFSAGGHLASTAGTHFKDGNAPGRISSRPDFMILVYPVISLMSPIGHIGSRNNLLGPDADLEMDQSLSNHLQVNSETPPTFLAHTSDDSGVSVENSIEFYMALIRAGVPAEMHLFETGRHGLGLGLENEAFRAWPALCIQWLRTREILKD